MKSRCFVCGAEGARGLGTQAGYSLVLCVNCRLVFVAPRPTPAEIAAAYASGSLIDENGTEERGPGGEVIYPTWKRRECEQIVDQIAVLARGRRLLDVGCLWGLLLETARVRGFQVTGVEPSREAAEYCHKRLGLRVLQGTLEEAADRLGQYNVITLLDVIEHCVDPVETIAKAVQHLAPRGVLCVGTPNLEGLIPRASRLKRRLFRQPLRCLSPPPPFHLFGFSRRSLSCLLSRSGFELERVRTLSSLDTVASHLPRKPGHAALLRVLSSLGKVTAAGDRMIIYARRRAPSAGAPAFATPASLRRPAGEVE